jgi:hypothetical protein
MTDIATRREAATAKVDAAKRAAASAILDGGKVDGGAVLTAQAELAAVDLAESEQARRDREAAAVAYGARQAECRAELASALEARLRAVHGAETATRALAAALADEREASRAATVAMAGLGEVIPISLTKSERERRLSEKLIAVLQTVLEHPRRFGSISIGPHREVPAGESWTKAESVEVNAALSPFTKG